MKREAITMLIFITIILLAGFCAFYRSRIHPVKDQTQQLRDSIMQLKKVILYSQFKEAKLHDTVELKDKAIQASERQVITIERSHARRIQFLQQAHQSTIDSLYAIFYPDSSKRNIVITHEEAVECDSMRTILKDQLALHWDKEYAQESELRELKDVQLPAWQKIDSTHQKLEMNLTDQLKREKGKRFYVGPSLNLNLDGSVRPGISIGYALFKF